MKVRLSILFTLSVCLIYAQEPTDISGTWYGTSSFLNSSHKVTITIMQKGSTLTGTSTSVNLNGKDSIKVRFNGTIEDGEVEILPYEVIYKSGMQCMANAYLTLTRVGHQLILDGKWKGDFGIKTCAPGTSGKMVLQQSKTAQISGNKVSSNASLAVLETDDIGNALVRELKKRKYHALIIGVEEYKDPSISTLGQPINDGMQLAEVLKDHYSFQEEGIKVLQNPGRATIIEALDQLANEVTEKDNLLIFYAGHGIWNEQLNQGYWLPSDASMSSKSYWISNSTIRDYVGGIPAKHTLLISDTCFSGGILKERAVFSNSRAMLELYKMPSRKAMTSGTLNTVPDKSVFMKYLIKNLETNTEPLLSADQLFRNFKIAVINNSPNGQVPQYGPISQAGDEGGDFIFLRAQ